MNDIQTVPVRQSLIPKVWDRVASEYEGNEKANPPRYLDDTDDDSGTSEGLCGEDAYV